jgi:poly(beta-D-mannuronate) lyase
LEISPAAISVTAAGKLNDGSNPAITLTTNQNWTVTSDSAWLTATPASGAAGSAIEVTLNVAANTIVAGRTAILTVTAGDSVKIVTVTQAAAVPDDGKPTGFVYFEDDFSWVTGGDDDIATHIVGTARNMYTWAPPGGVAGDCLTLFNAYGYTDDVNPTNQVIYFMNGYLKFSKTRYHGGLSFYATSLGTTPTDVTFSFDKVTYKSNPAGNPTAGNYDPNNKAGITTFALVVAIDGLGSVGVNDGTTKTTEACDMFKTNGTPWAWENVEIVLYGITKDTKITIKTNQVDTPDMLCRYYLDNLKVVKR